jgi:hypothetical protein
MISKQHRGCDGTRTIEHRDSTVSLSEDLQSYSRIASIYRSYKEFDRCYCLKTALKADEGDMKIIAVGSVLRTSYTFARLSIDKVVTVVYKITSIPLDHGKGKYGLIKLNRISHVHVCIMNCKVSTW